MRSTIIRSITTIVLIITMAIGMTASLSGKTHAASKITVTWKGNGGKNSQNQTQHYTYYYNQSSVTLKPSGTLYTRPGYTLLGFHANGKTYNVGTSFTITTDTTITCVWKANTYKIVYHENGGQVGSIGSAGLKQSFTNDKSVTLAPPGFYKTGYVLLGFSKSKSASSAEYIKGKTYTFSSSSDVDLYAVWGPQVTFNANGGSLTSGKTTQVNSASKTSITVTIPSVNPRDGYTFKGFSTTGKTNATVYTSGKSYTFNSAINLIAIWEPIPARILPQKSVKLTGNSGNFIQVKSGNRTTYGADQGDFKNLGNNMLLWNELADAFNKRINAPKDKPTQNDYLDIYEQLYLELQSLNTLSSEWNKCHGFLKYYENIIAKNLKSGGSCAITAALNTAYYINAAHGNYSYTKKYKDVALDLEGIATIHDLSPNLVDMAGFDITKGATWSYMMRIMNSFNYSNKKYTYEVVNCSDKQNIEKKLKEMLSSNIPVPMSFYASNGNYLCEYTAEQFSTDTIVLRKYRDNFFDNHFFVVTGVYLNADNSIKWLEISTWGGKAYLDWAEYWREKNSTIQTNAIIWIH